MRAALISTLAVGAVLMSLYTDLVYRSWPYGIDLEIPLRAAARWSAGDAPYLASSFTAVDGRDLPFLYPPFVLPIVAPLLALPRDVVYLGWFLVLAAALCHGLHRLGIRPWLWLPIALWTPAFEGIVTGNVQLLLFAAFAVVVTAPVTADRTAPAGAARLRPGELRLGTLAALVGAIKVTQGHTWLWFLRRRPAAAIAGAAVLATIALATVPLTGLDAYETWVRHVSMASDPSWLPIGFPLGMYLGRELGVAVTFASLVAAALLPRGASPAWVGVLTVWGSPSLHNYGLLFLLPAMLRVRLEIRLLVALLLASVPAGIWLGIAILTVALLLTERSGRPASASVTGAPQTAATSAERTIRAPSS